ncbi:MAG TPA: LytTR family DNA-binding domain-containing protein [Saprospiraceae bacterium]|nr:LytTR family DNA-binding domain-containing protein [Saprospiraceae bacterium]
MLRIAIIDDEPDAITVLTKFIEHYMSDYVIVGFAHNVDTAVKLLISERPNVVLLDIQLRDGTGFDILDHFTNNQFKVIFITAYDQYAIRAFQYQAINYLLKPIGPKEFCQAFDHLNSLLFDNYASQYKNSPFKDYDKIFNKLTIPTFQGFTKVKVKDIIRIESEGNYTTFYVSGGTKTITSKNIGFFELLLDPIIFFRVHQSHIINLDYVKNYENKENGGVIILENGEKIPISRRKKDSFLEIFMK